MTNLPDSEPEDTDEEHETDSESASMVNETPPPSVALPEIRVTGAESEIEDTCT